MSMAQSLQQVQACQQAVNPHPEIAGNFPLDDAVLDALPKGLIVLSADSYGSSAWSATARITATSSDGTQSRFFLKYATGESGKAQLEGEYAAMSALYDATPTFVPRPRGYGKLKLESPRTYFFISDFLDFNDQMPDPAKLGAQLADLHRHSVSPNGKFGFHISTFDGRLPQNVHWNSSWASFFADLLVGVLRLDVAANGFWEELENIVDRTVEEVIPRLLGALESEGRSIKPSLIHGDLWEGNIGTEISTGNIFVFDACSYYAHNEMELGIWRTDHHRMKAKIYKREYLRNMKPSEPVEQWDDRNRLYSCKTRLMYSAHVPGTQVRKQAYEDLAYLLNKYGEKASATETSGGLEQNKA